MLYPLYRQKPIIPSLSAQEELDKIGADLWLVKEVLERGYDCAASRRKPNIVEKCIRKKDKEIRVVAVLVKWKDKSFWRVIHVGKTGRHR